MYQVGDILEFTNPDFDSGGSWGGNPELIVTSIDFELIKIARVDNRRVYGHVQPSWDGVRLKARHPKVRCCY